jgi:uncharacterized protein
MRRNDKEITDRQIIEEILSRSEICRIAMVDGNRPYIVPVNYGYSNGAIYIHGANQGKKIDLLKMNNRVCFEIEQKSEIVKSETSCGWTTRYRSLIGTGTIEFITDSEQKKKGLDIIMAQYGKTQNNQYNDLQVEIIVILKLNIEQITAKQSGDWKN